MFVCSQIVVNTTAGSLGADSASVASSSGSGAKATGGPGGSDGKEQPKLAGGKIEGVNKRTKKQDKDKRDPKALEKTVLGK